MLPECSKQQDVDGLENWATFPFIFFKDVYVPNKACIFLSMKIDELIGS